MNRVEITGRLTADPEVRRVSNGKYPIASLTVVVDDPDGRWDKETGRRFVDSGFYDVEIMGEYGEWIAENADKGDHVYVVGSLTQWRRPPGKDGKPGETKTRIAGRMVQILKPTEYMDDEAKSDDLDRSSWDGVSA